MGFLPGWESADSTATIAHNLHIAAIVILGMLVFAEAMALVYDSRKEHLLSIAASNAEAEHKRNTEAAEARRKTEVESLQGKLSQASERLEEIRKQQAHRRLSSDQKAALIEALSPFGGQRIAVAVAMGTDDGLPLGNDFIEMFNAAGWVANGPDQTIFGNNPNEAQIIGVQITINQVDQQAGIVLPSAIALHAALARIGLADPKAVFMEMQVPRGEISLKIGPRPSVK